MKTQTLILGGVLAVYSLAGILSERVWQNNEAANRLLCRALLCNNMPLIAMGRQQLAGTSEREIRDAIATFRSVLQRAPQDAYRWADLGEALVDGGQLGDARYCFARVVGLAPLSAPLLFRSANFHFQLGENDKGLEVSATILSMTGDYDEMIFGEYARFTVPIEDVLQRGLPADSRAAKSWLRFLVQAGRMEDGQHTWDWMVRRGFADDRLAGEFVAFLIRQGRPDSAASVWRQYLGPRTGEYGESNYIFNGSFESEPAPSPFDWSLASVPGADIARDCTSAWAGQCSLHIVFAGTQNLNVVAASQLAIVRPGPHRLHAVIQTENLTTDEGIRLRVFDAEMPSRVNEVFDNFTGTKPWSPVEHDLAVPRATRLLEIQVIRQSSLRFDNKISGTAWIDEVRLESLDNRPSR